MNIGLKHTRLGLRNSTTRLPFRYGTACLTRCPQAVLEATIEVCGSRTIAAGYAGDCFPPGWFDKTPGKSFAQQIDDMLAVIALAQAIYQEEFRPPTPFFEGWLIAQQRVQQAAADRGLTPLLASFGSSMLERAIIDAICRSREVTFHQALGSGSLRISPQDLTWHLSFPLNFDWLKADPLRSVFVRHTVGLIDPLTVDEIALEDRLDDGFPQALEEYITQSGISHFKIKVSNRLEHDVSRLTAIARLVESHLGPRYKLTLDGNEQYKSADEFDELMETLRSRPDLETLLENVIAIEQPLDRKIALDPNHTQGIRKLGQWRPVIIDESDGTLDAYAQAIELGYRGVSSKNCKGPIKSLLNMCQTWVSNECGKRNEFIMTGEDLCTVGVVPVQADLCLAATLGLTHVERNGHHYHPGLSYLPEEQQKAALASHPDLYARHHGRIAPRVFSGRFEIGSLQCPGFGFAVTPDMDAMQSPDEWEFSSLGL